MSSYDVTLNYSEVGNFLKGPEVESMIQQIGSQIADRAGIEYAYRVHNTGKRLAVNVYPATPHAYYSNLKHDTLLTALK